MSDQHIRAPTGEVITGAPPPSPIRDRRRPGRIEDVSPELIPLMRHPDDLEPDRDDIRPMTGIVVAVLLSVPVWAGIALFVRWLVR